MGAFNKQRKRLVKGLEIKKVVNDGDYGVEHSRYLLFTDGTWAQVVSCELDATDFYDDEHKMLIRLGVMTKKDATIIQESYNERALKARREEYERLNKEFGE